MTKTESELYGELAQIEFEIILKLKSLINEKWNSSSIKNDIEKLIVDLDEIYRKLDKLEDND